MVLKVFPDKKLLGQAAATQAAMAILRAIGDHGTARVVAATAASQSEFLDALVREPEVDWTRVELFHLDEYIGLPVTHPGSFRKMLLERLVHKTGIKKYHLLDGDADPSEVVVRVGQALASAPIDIEFLGIGENGHIAFNDPPADFETEKPYLIVNLDEACRRQQVGEAWFSDISQVPKQAISMSVKQILKAKEILAVVPDTRKAQAVKACFEAEISPMAPASILRHHPNATVYLDENSAALLNSSLRTYAVGS
jgi:glucosamine-6-phosphate deaminase